MSPYLRLALVAAGAFIWGAAPGYCTADTNLPDLGDESATVISAADERILGENFIHNARRQLDFLDEPELNAYLSSLGNRLVAQGDDYPYGFRFYLVKDANLNAFAVPGGFVAVHTGLILATETESELASVLAHEVSHVTQRHMPRMLAQARHRSIPTMVALIAAVLLGGQAGEAAIALTSAAAIESQLKYTRAFERESDRIGMRTLVKAGFDPRAMPAFFERLQSRSRVYDADVPEFLRTHPVTSDRIAEARDRAQSAAPGVKDSAAFRHARAKIRVLTAKNTTEVEKFFADRLNSGKEPHIDATRYGYALALLANRRYPEARRVIGVLLRDHPENPSYRIVKAEIEMAAGNRRRGLAIYQNALEQSPGYRPLTQRYAAALLQTGRAAKAKALLEQVVRQQTDDPALFRLLATAAGDTGDRVAAHRALAEYYYLSGEPRAAVNQLHLASRFVGNNLYIQSSVEARIKEIQEEIALYEDG